MHLIAVSLGIFLGATAAALTSDSLIAVAVPPSFAYTIAGQVLEHNEALNFILFETGGRTLRIYLAPTTQWREQEYRIASNTALRMITSDGSAESLGSHRIARITVSVENDRILARVIEIFV